MTVTRREIWNNLNEAIVGGLPVPRYVKDTECIVTGAAPLLVIRLDLIDEALAWAEHIGISEKMAIHERPGLVGISCMGDWLGWRVLLLSDELATEAVARALLTPDAVIA